MKAAVLLALTVLAGVAPADVFTISDSERGWVVTSGNNGAVPGNNYIAGNLPNALGLYRDWFEFAIPTLTGGPLISATLQLDEPGQGHQGPPFTYAVYGLSGQPMVFTDVTTTNPFGSVDTSAASNGTTVDIMLNATALSAISAAQGGNIFIGGIDSGELSLGFDFGSNTGFAQLQTVLSLTTTAEPSSPPLLATILVAFGIALRKQRAKATNVSSSRPANA